jgi:hypothetical protein
MMKSDLKNVSRHIEFVAEGPREMMCLPKKNKPPQTTANRTAKVFKNKTSKPVCYQLFQKQTGRQPDVNRT